MSEIPKTLEEIGNEVKAIHAALGFQIKTTFERASAAGKLLIRGKPLAGHGRFEAWVRSLGIGMRNAQRYMQCAKGEEAAKATGKSHLTIGQFTEAMSVGKRRLTRERYGPQAEVPCLDEGSGIVTGDSLDWLRAQPPESVPFFVSDPPYGVGKDFDGRDEPDSPEDYWEWFEPYWKEMQRAVVPGGSIVLYQAFRYWRHLYEWYEGGQVIPVCYLVRGVHTCDPLVRWVKPGAKSIVYLRAWADWIQTPNKEDRRKVLGNHPGIKPVAECRDIVRRYTLPGMLVVDPFCGTGSIPLAAKLEGRQWLGYELSPKYARVARGRLSGGE